MAIYLNQICCAGTINFNSNLYRVGLGFLPLFFAKKKSVNGLFRFTLLMVCLAGLEPTTSASEGAMVSNSTTGAFCIIISNYSFLSS